MTDITRLINDLNLRMHSAKNLGFDFLFLKLDDLDVITGALETLQRANTAQGDHIEQLQGTIHQLESRTVKIPYLPDDCDRTEAHFKYRAALTAVGINVIEGEENNG
ncbi:hypothetical protein [Klebsiella michiganensis]|uniref:hypothetical protein n=1 Tax=Klebsiella michiganensis TaxID=1134687 RepID=UPI0015AC3D3B|nr:hypothetical protein [Klebsiella michiganensis]HBM2887003.1 hypothetical protein [Klebsiella oxytoca]